MALQLQNAVNASIMNTNNISLLQQAQNQPPQTPPPNQVQNGNGNSSNNNNSSSQSDSATNVSGEQTQQTTQAQPQTPTQQIVIGPQQGQQISTTINGHQPAISATPTLINVA
eukprot:CAMPEP_0201597000 /NCGR_PEP_ID=MMETSP0190_2-20130828/193582_1 /ASSEMBLY_ACC=CAM_ASM_000263 /TAXON_ID=37353 /ORGANISM="Rosalina sp." /LENGTH=112 /DNA_ID=CAMNT_0048057707 /DNA_START=710 /DNA_END=1045 /DNA_ORIENTATION=+